MIQLPGKGERIVANLGSWRGRTLDQEEWEWLQNCPCPGCQLHGAEHMSVSGMEGFCHRATHNLWTLIDEAKQIDTHIQNQSYRDWYLTHVNNSTYLPLIRQAVKWLEIT